MRVSVVHEGVVVVGGVGGVDEGGHAGVGCSVPYYCKCIQDLQSQNSDIPFHAKTNHTTSSTPQPQPQPPDVDGWLKFATLCRKSGRPRQAERMLVQLLRYDPRSITTPHTPGYGAGSGAPPVMLAFVKHLWATGSRQEALARLQVCGGVAVGWMGRSLVAGC